MDNYLKRTTVTIEALDNKQIEIQQLTANAMGELMAAQETPIEAATIATKYGWRKPLDTNGSSTRPTKS